MNPSVATEISLSTLIENKRAYEDEIREKYRMCLEAIGNRITMKNEEGEYTYWIPGSIQVMVLTNNLDQMIQLLCTEEKS